MTFLKQDAVGGLQVRHGDIDPHTARGTYGEYLFSKVGRVFPALHEEALKS